MLINWYWKEADQLESEQKWNEARDYMYLEWRKEPQDLKKFIRLSFLCWYVLVEWDCLEGNSNMNRNDYEQLLMELTITGVEDFGHTADFLWIYGYMISLFPYYFGEYEAWEEKGCRMLKEAHKLKPDDPIIRWLYLGSKKNRLVGSTFLRRLFAKEYQGVHRMVSTAVDLRFKGDGCMQRYFKEVLKP